MNINTFQHSLGKLGLSGNTISPEKCVILHTSLMILQKHNHFKKVFLWGRIYATENDYYIAYGYESNALKGRVFYYSTNCMDWGLLPKPNKPFKPLALISPMIFQGDPAIEFDVPLEGFDGMEGLNEIKPPSNRKSLKLKEEDRLALVVWLINEEAAIIPRGALFKRTDGVIVENEAFTGLSLLEANFLRSYLHYRKPHERWNTNLLMRPKYNFALDFLDTIDADIPLGCWSLEFEMGGRISLLRSLYWPGMTFYHCIGTQEHGFLYVGTGKRNIDIPFMIP